MTGTITILNNVVNEAELESMLWAKMQIRAHPMFYSNGISPSAHPRK